MDAVKKNGVRLTPVDSEHSAIFQSLEGNDHKALKRILLTASGGPFRGKKREELRHVTVKECMNHPTWSMGTKVTLDSSTLANKGLEVIEAHWLFEASYDQIVPIIHPQSMFIPSWNIKTGCHCPAWRARYAAAHPVCAQLSRALARSL